MNKLEFKKLIREEIRKVLKEAKKYPRGFVGVDDNGYDLKVVDGPYNSVEDLTNAIETKYKKAKDILDDEGLMLDLDDEDPLDVGGLYLVYGPDYGGSHYTVISGVNIFKN